jgi:hypothetical protein
MTRLDKENGSSQEKQQNGQQQDETEKEDLMLLVLDDGTGILHCFSPMAMMERVSVLIGQTFDCIGLVKTTFHDEPLLMVETLLEARDSSAAERLRWMEIITSNPNANNNKNKTRIAWCGYPCPQVNCEDILDLIHSGQDDGGVTVTELALVMDMEESHVLALVEELQIQGQIYQNERACYVPL